MVNKIKDLRIGSLVKLSISALEGGYDNDPESAKSVGIVLGFEYGNTAKPIVYWAQHENIYTEEVSDLNPIN